MKFKKEDGKITENIVLEGRKQVLQQDRRKKGFQVREEVGYAYNS